MSESIDITPNPRVLRMLGEIDFKAWQCLCEIIDNSIDSFKSCDVNSVSAPKPSIKVKLPGISQNQLKSTDHLTIEDNGEGMTFDVLSKSLTAGFSGNSPIDKMGLFGMGFNISTARLGNRTEVITSTKDSDEFLKVTIDFQELETKGHFDVPVERIPKKADEKFSHGTRIIVTKLKTDHIKPLYQRKKITAKLGKIYGRIIREKEIKLVYAGQACKPFKHCVWSEKRNGQAKAGSVPAILNIDELIDSKKYCSTCWVWLNDFESECPSCNETSAISKRERRIKGWIGIQRYFSSDHFGIDLIRNGRVIRELDKSFFDWINNDEEVELEYPIDGHQRLGRIVGELELDFVKVTHQKDAFETNTQDWRDVVLAVRGDGPIRPQIAKSCGYAINTSPVARLFSAFRTAKASVKNLVPQRKNGQAMITDTHIDELVRRFYDGENDYQSDDKWWSLLNEVNSNKDPTPTNNDPTGGDPFDSGESSNNSTGGNPFDSGESSDNSAGGNPFDSGESSDNSSASEGGQLEPFQPKEKPEVRSEPDLILSKNYSLDLFKNISIRVVAQRVLDGVHQNGFHVELKGVELQFTYWPKSNIFENSLLTAADFLINELAYHMHSISQNEVSRVPISAVEIAIREKYFFDLYPTVDELHRQVRIFHEDLTEHLRSKTEEFNINLLDIDPSDLLLIKKRMVQNEYLDDSQVETALQQGEFLSYAPFSVLKVIICDCPNLVFDGVFFNTKWKSDSELSLLMKLQKNELVSLLDDIDWFNDNYSTPGGSLWRGRVKRLIGSLEILISWRI
jgi:hypothetical protein